MRNDPSNGQWLKDALHDLGNVYDEAASDEDYITPSEGVIERSRTVLGYMYKKLPFRYEVYPMQDGSVSVEVAPRNPNETLAVNCESGGRIICFFATGDIRSRKASFKSISVMFSDCFLQGVIDEIARHPHFQRYPTKKSWTHLRNLLEQYRPQRNACEDWNYWDLVSTISREQVDMRTKIRPMPLSSTQPKERKSSQLIGLGDQQYLILPDSHPNVREVSLGGPQQKSVLFEKRVVA